MTPRVLVLGAGPAGAGGAYRLRKLNRAQVTLVEQKGIVGGNAGSFDWNGHRLDFGSHRLHPACDPEILAEIRQLMGDELLDRPRHGRIRLRGRWIHFPLKPVDLLLRLDPAFATGVLADMARKKLPRTERAGRESFATVLRQGLGGTICDEFYFPYARKIWGREPEELSAIQARRRVSAGSFGKLVKKVLSAVPGMKPPGAGRFFYPRNGYGAITEAYVRAAESAGADVLLGWRVTELKREGERWTATLEKAAAPGSPAEQRTVEADYVWSTLPVTLLARMVRDPAPAPEVMSAASSLSYRSMMLVYLELPVEQFTEFDAHYFPGADVRITRLSEPKNYAVRSEPRGRTVLCAELPCSPDDPWWSWDDAALGRLVADDLAQAGLPLPALPSAVHVERLRHAYPIYLTGYEAPFAVLDRWADSVPGMLTYGRQGLFAHDNTHHALYMAYSAAKCLESDGQFNRERWQEYRRIFETHVVED
ncbi:MAG TPA: FAD-dependent oxidoreductase [Longimicrobiales bacterium]